MLNLTNLLTSLFITLGVGVSTPNCDTPKIKKPFNTNSSQNSNTIIANYNQQINVVNNSSDIFTTRTQINDIAVDEIPEYYPSDVNYASNDQEQKWNITSNSNYINLVGNIYATYPSNQDNADHYYFILNNKGNMQSDPNVFRYKTTRLLYVMRIDSYNYNLDNNLELKLYLTMENPTYYSYQGDTYENIIESYSLLKTLYTMTSSNEQNGGIGGITSTNWDTFIGRQLTSYTTNTILSEINDPNENYYYSQDISIESREYNNETSITTECDISLIPNGTTYIVLDIVPLIESTYRDREYTSNSWTYDYRNNFVTTIDNGYERVPINPAQDNNTISGTNVIPSGTYEVIDIPGLMWEILTMPFAFISQAFNLTLFPGTQFQINIANLFLSILAVFAFTFLVSVIVKHFV